MQAADQIQTGLGAFQQQIPQVGGHAAAQRLFADNRDCGLRGASHRLPDPGDDWNSPPDPVKDLSSISPGKGAIDDDADLESVTAANQAVCDLAPRNPEASIGEHNCRAGRGLFSHGRSHHPCGRFAAGVRRAPLRAEHHPAEVI